MKALLKSDMKYFCCILLCLGLSCKNGLTRNFNTGEALGTTFNITYLSDGERNYQEAIDSVFAQINASMSTYLPDSDISRINRGDSTVVVDSMFREVLAISRLVHAKTKGHFDPTVGILVNAWGFGPGPSVAMDTAKVDSLLQYVGLSKITLTQDNRIRKENPGIQLDFNAVAKGYAIDRLAVLLDRKGIQNYLVEVGGELVSKGTNLIQERPWVVGIDDPQVESGRALKLTVHLKDRALASSGNYRKFRIDTVSGRKYVHTIDPLTGFTKNSNVLAATVLANTCAVADAYATAFMAMDLDESIKLLVEQKELEAYIIYLDEAGNSKEFMTTGFRNIVVDGSAGD